MNCEKNQTANCNCEACRPDLYGQVYPVPQDSIAPAIENRYIGVFYDTSKAAMSGEVLIGIQAVVDAVRRDVFQQAQGNKVVTFIDSLIADVSNRDMEIHNLKELLAQAIEHTPQYVISPANGDVPDWFVEAAFIVHRGKD